MRPGKYDTSEHTLVELVKDRAVMLDSGRAALIALAIELSDGRALPHDCDTLLEWARFELVEHLPEVMLEGGFVAKHGPMGALARVRDMIATLDGALRAVRQIEGLLIDDIEHSRRENAANENGGAK
jgi:hypothetical protein